MKALVTGGGGFLGLAIVRQLLERQVSVRTLNRSAYPSLDALPVEQHRGDIADAAVVDAAVAGCDAVFHVAAKAGVWGSWSDYTRTNVAGTKHVIQACRQHEVAKLIYTSSPSVVHGGGDIEGSDESLAYPARYKAPYPATKARAEQLVLAANSDSMATVSLRPHLIWGPGDNHLVPRIVSRARAGRLWQVGSAPRLIDTVYVDNAAEAHLLAYERLAPDQPCAGRAYFISQGEPVPSWKMINDIVAAAGLPPVTRRMPAWAAYTLGAVLEFVYGLLRRKAEPPMTRFLARQLATAHWYDISAARQDLGYTPRISIEEGLERLSAHLRGEAERV